VDENIVKTYEKQLSPLLIGVNDFTIGEEIGRGMQICDIKHYAGLFMKLGQ